ncbi:MAG: insulinase family protein [Phycisphaerales bacterium]|nr:insulinase family protein [Phycisphaerales bacterium]
MNTTAPNISSFHTASGLRIVFEKMDAMESASMQMFIPAGSAHDDADALGGSAVAAEILLRGAGALDSRAQADAFDQVGALRNSSVGVRFLSISASVVGARIVEALPLVVDMVRSPRFTDSSLAPACELAKAGIASLADDPQQRAVLGARSRHLPAPYNRDTLGTEGGIDALSSEQLANWWASHAVPSGSILSIAGSFDTERVLASLDSLLKGWSGERAQPAVGDAPDRGYAHEIDDSNQVQVVVLHDGPKEGADDSVLERIAVNVLSGGMSGRLFTEVREKRGLCYAVSSSYRADCDRGVVTSYVGTTPERAQESLDVLLEQLAQINAGDVTKEEFDRALIGMKSRLVFAGESTRARAGACAADMANLGRVRTLDEIVSRIDSVTLDELNAYLRRRDPGTPTIQTLGPDALTPPAAR